MIRHIRVIQQPKDHVLIQAYCRQLLRDIHIFKAMSVPMTV